MGIEWGPFGAASGGLRGFLAPGLVRNLALLLVCGIGLALPHGAQAEVTSANYSNLGSGPPLFRNLSLFGGTVVDDQIRPFGQPAVELLWNTTDLFTVELSSSDPGVVSADGSTNCGVGGQVAFCSARLNVRAPGSTVITVRAFDLSGALTNQFTFTLNIAAVAPAAPFGVAATAGDGQARVTFVPPTFEGGTPITGYTVTSNPGGITATGAGSPIEVLGLDNGTSYTFTVTASNAVGTSPASSPSNSVIPPGVPVANSVAATVGYGSAAEPIPLDVVGIDVVSVDVVNPPENGTAVATGTSITYAPAAGYAGPDSFTYTATNVAGTSAPAVVSVTVGEPDIVFVTPQPAAAVAGQPYSQSLAAATGGAAPYTYALNSGSLPSGVSFGTDGVLTGTPTEAGDFEIGVSVTDSSTGTGPFSVDGGTVTLRVATADITLTPDNLPGGVFAEPYSARVEAQGGVAPYTFALDGGALPPGLSLSPGGELSGVPSQSGRFTLSITATDSTTGTGGPSSAARTYEIDIGAAVQTITFPPQAGQVFVPDGSFAIDPPATASSGLAVSYSSQTEAVCTVSGTTVTMRAAGTCTIAADQAGDANFEPAPQVTQSIPIGQGAQAITDFVANPAAPVFAQDATFTLSASGGASGNPVVFASTTPSVCTVSGSSVTMRSAGSCSLTAEQSGNADWTAAPPVTLVVDIAAGLPSLSWIDGIEKTVGEPAFELPLPDSNSEGAFTFTSSDPQVATVAGRTVTIIGAGTAMLMAHQSATSDFTEASISVTLTVSSRPDPTRDPSVVGGLQAQVDASVRLAAAQQSNLQGRLRQLRAAGERNVSSNQLTLSLANAGGERMSLPITGADPSALGESALPEGWGAWVAGSITLGERDGSARSDGFDLRSDGVSVGVDRRIGASGILGMAGGFGRSDADFDDARSNLKADQRSLSAYGLWRGSEHLYVEGVLGWGRLDFDIRRWSASANATGSARRDGDQLFGSLALGYEQPVGTGGMVTGYGRVDAVRTTLDPYRESGLDIYDLTYRGQVVRTSTAAVGIEGSHPGQWGARAVRPFWSLEYRDALRSQGEAALNYVVQPVATDFSVGLRRHYSNTIAAGAGLDLALGRGWQLSIEYRREQGRDVVSDMFGLRLVFSGSGEHW